MKIIKLRQIYKALSAILCVISFSFQGCINNDIPYPVVQLNILDIGVDGMVGRPVISVDDKSVTINVADTANLRRLRVSKIEITDKAQSSLAVNDYIDLSGSFWLTLSLYDEVYWKLTANQSIDRSFRVANQVGIATFDLANKIAYANVVKGELFLPQSTDIVLQELKLGPTGSTINNTVTTTPVVTWSWEGSFWRSKVVVNFKHFDQPEEWTLLVFPVETTVSTVRADAWVNIAYLHGEGQVDVAHGFELREATSSNWERVDSRLVVSTLGSFTARIPHLKAETSYVFRAISGEDYGAEVTFTTGKATPLTNGSFDQWHKAGKVWNPWADGATPFWDSGNDGASTLGESNTQPSSDVAPGAADGTFSAKLESKFVGIGTIGKFAAGNLFVGEFKQVDGTNGILDFGKPFTARPTRLKGYYKFTTAPINYASTEYQSLKGLPDTCSIYIALGDWDSPIEIRTNPKNPKFFDINDKNIIAYAEFYSGTSVTEYTPIELTLNYRATNRVPTYLVLVCSASKYGDFFTGGAGSVLYVDEFTLEYDDEQE